MNGTIQQQHNVSQQIAGIIRNFRKVITRTGKPMAVFTVGTTPAKCFDLMVGTAEQWADTGKNVSISGHFSNHSGQSELVVQTIGPLPSRPDGQGLPGTTIDQNVAGPAIDNRPDQAALEVTDNYIVITIPVGVTQGQVHRIIDVANEALRGVGPGVFDSATVRVQTIHPKDQVQEGVDIPF